MSGQSNNGRLLKTSIIYFIGNFASKILSFLLVPIYTTWLTVESYGTIDLVFTANEILVPILSLQVTQGMFRYLLEAKSKSEKKKIITSSYLVIVVGSLILCMAMLPYAILNRSVEWAIACPYIIIGMTNGYVVQMTRGLGKNVLYAATSTLTSILQITSNLLFIVGLSLGSISLLLAPMLGSLLSLIILLCYQKQYEYFDVKSYDFSIIKKILKFSVPTVPATLVWWGMTGFSKLFLSAVAGEGALGIFSMSSKFSDIIITVYSVFNLAWTEVAYISYEDEGRDSYYKEVFNNLCVFVFSAIVLAIPAIKLLAPFFLKGEFFEASVYIPMMFMVCFLNIVSQFLASIFNAFKKTQYILYGRIFGTVANVILNIVLVPQLGIWGTVIGLCIAMLIDCVCFFISSRKFVKFSVGTKVFMILPVFVGVLYLYYQTDLKGANVLSLLIAVTVFLVFNFKMLKTFLKQLFGLVKKRSNT